MKNVMILILALVMAVALSVPAFATETSDPVRDPYGSDAYAKYHEGIRDSDAISVDVVWGSMLFTYTVTGTMDWDPVQNTYIPNLRGEWSGTNNTITLTNHSGTAITATFSYKPLQDFSMIAGSFSDGNVLVLPSAVDKDINAPELTGQKTLFLNGVLSHSISKPIKVGNVTVTIS